ncbi:MAG TPA: hypothetical protein VGI92_07380 [Gemmatimonadales bacterium]|jgi:predicted metalloprotease with PDZ domain
MTRTFSILLAALAIAAPLAAQARRAAPAADASVSAPITNVRYELTFDSASAAQRRIGMKMTFDVAGAAPVLLALPAWSPGAYDISNFSRHVSHFSATMNGQPRRWDKYRYDTWRVRPEGAGTLEVAFDFEADTLDNAMAWSKPDFLMVNGTNVFFYPEGRSLEFPAQVTVHTQPGWLVTTGMHAARAPLTYHERNYHDLVDMPMFIGHFDVDSQQISGKWTRLATYPAGTHAGPARVQLWSDLAKIIPQHSAVFGVTPWDDYTVYILYQPFGGISALEHQSSNVGISDPQFVGTPILTNVIAHEIFHAWNVKRLRPAQMVPYRYDAPEQTTLLWVSEGFTDYYADLGEVRGGAIDSAGFLRNLMGHFSVVAQAPPTSVEDASLSTWIHPTDGSDALYYDKGATIGFLLDVLIRNASDDQQSLDAVMRGLYQASYLHGRGFTNEEFWTAVSRAAGGKSFASFYDHYVDGRDSLPYDSVLPLAGMKLVTTTTKVARMGVSSRSDSAGALPHVMQVVPGGAFAAAGVEVGDTLISVGGIDQKADPNAEEFRRRFSSHEGEAYPVVVRRNGQELTLTAHVVLRDNTVTQLEYDAAAGPKALRVRGGILRASK